MPDMTLAQARRVSVQGRGTEAPPLTGNNTTLLIPVIKHVWIPKSPISHRRNRNHALRGNGNQKIPYIGGTSRRR
jgi:hypothetical protein